LAQGLAQARSGIAGFKAGNRVFNSGESGIRIHGAEYNNALYKHNADSTGASSEQIDTVLDAAKADVTETMPSKDADRVARLLEASKAGQWAVVATLAKELEARRGAK
jgi:hypothetical protein